MTTSMPKVTKDELRSFAKENMLSGLSMPSVVAIYDGRTEGFTVRNGQAFLREFRPEIEKQLFSHNVVKPPGNKFYNWFVQGTMTIKQMKAFHLQYTVFSRRFPIAQAYKVANAPTWMAFLDSLELLLSEYGTGFTKNKDGEYSVFGSKCLERLIHYGWLLDTTEPLGLVFDNTGFWHFGTNATKRFGDHALIGKYGSEDPEESVAATLAVENWANRYMWPWLIDGIKKFNCRAGKDLRHPIRDKDKKIVGYGQGLNLNFYTAHNGLEHIHAGFTWAETEALYLSRNGNVDRDNFIAHMVEMLDEILAWHDGLYDECMKQA